MLHSLTMSPLQLHLYKSRNLLCFLYYHLFCSVFSISPFLLHLLTTQRTKILKTLFKQKIAEFREACCIMTGFKMFAGGGGWCVLFFFLKVFTLFADSIAFFLKKYISPFSDLIGDQYHLRSLFGENETDELIFRSSKVGIFSGQVIYSYLSMLRFVLLHIDFSYPVGC